MSRGKSPQERAKITERQTIALELRKEGWSYRAIAAKCDVDHATSYTDVKSALKALVKERDEKAEALRYVEVMRLDDLIKGLYPMAKVGHVPSVLAMIKVSESRRKLLGLDAPVKIEADIHDYRSQIAEQGVNADIFLSQQEQLSKLSVEEFSRLIALAAESATKE